MGPRRRTAQRISSVASAIACGALAGCALISGAGDLTVGDADGAAATVGGDVDGAGMPDGSVVPAVDGSRGRFDGATGDVNVPSDGGGDAGSRLRNATFEDGAILGVHGGDTMSGVVSLVTSGALSGADSIRVANAVGGIEVDVPMLSEVYATALVQAEATPFNDDLTIFAFVPESGGTIAELHLVSVGFGGPHFALVIGGRSVGTSGAITAKTVYRVGFHLLQDSATNLIEVFSGSPTTAFGPAIITSPSVLGRTIGVRMGLLAGTAISGTFTFDNLLIDTAAMPAP